MHFQVKTHLQVSIGYRHQRHPRQLQRPGLCARAALPWVHVVPGMSRFKLCGTFSQGEPLMLLRNRILDHWYEFRPTLVRDLERSGELAAVVAALEQTILEKQAVMLNKGLSLEQADEFLRPMWMISDDDS